MVQIIEAQESHPWAHAVAKKAAIFFKISVSLLVSNPGVSMSTTRLPVGGEFIRELDLGRT